MACSSHQKKIKSWKFGGNVITPSILSTKFSAFDFFDKEHMSTLPGGFPISFTLFKLVGVFRPYSCSLEDGHFTRV
jgi:hypothetical protein